MHRIMRAIHARKILAVGRTQVTRHSEDVIQEHGIEVDRVIFQFKAVIRVGQHIFALAEALTADWNGTAKPPMPEGRGFQRQQHRGLQALA